MEQLHRPTPSPEQPEEESGSEGDPEVNVDFF